MVRGTGDQYASGRIQPTIRHSARSVPHTIWLPTKCRGVNVAARKPKDDQEAPAEGAAAPRKRVQSDFPKFSLEEALRVAEAIESANGGRPYPPADTAIALDISPGSSDWRTLTAASFKYGLTTGTYKTERLALTDLAERVVSPTSDEDQVAALFTAAISPRTFNSIFEYFKGKKLPASNFLENTIVREFSVPKEHAGLCASVFIKNAQFVGLTRTTKTGQWLGDEPSGLPPGSLHGDDERGEGDDDFAGEEEEATDHDAAPPSPRADPAPRRGKGKAVFLGHGKNKKPMEQLQKILTEYGVPFKVAVDEPNKGRPISEKVAQVMENCGAAILVFTADEEFRTVDGDEVWRPSENVVYELGASAVMYGKRIIIFKEAGVTFPSNFRDIGYIEFEKDSLAAKGVDLFRELIAFNIIQVSVPDA